MKKPILIGILVVLVAIGVGIFLLSSNLNSLVAGVIEKEGSEVTETRVGVSGVEISIREGRGSIKGLSVDSPEGFDAGEAFSLGDITIDLDLKSIREDPIVIDEVRILAPVVRAQFDEKGKSNIDELRRRAEAFSGGGASSSGGEGGTTPNIRIRRFVFAEGKVGIDASALGVEAKELALPSIELRDLGGANGAPPAQIAKEIFSAVARKVVDTVARSEVDRLIRQNLDESVVDRAKRLLDKIGN